MNQTKGPQDMPFLKQVEHLEIEQQTSTKVSFFKENASVIYALLCAIFFAMHNYLIAFSMHQWRNSVSIMYPEFISLMLSAVIYHAVYVPLFMKKERFSEIKAVYWKDGKFNNLAFGVIILRGLNAFAVPLIFALMFYFCAEVGTIPAVVQSFTTFSSFVTAIFFYFMYGEKLTLAHLTGMVLIISGVIIVAVAKSITHMTAQTRNPEDDLYLTAVEEHDEIIAPTTLAPSMSLWYVMVPYLIAFILCFFLTFSSYLSRLSKVAWYPPIQFCLDFSFASGVLFLVSFIYCHFIGPDPYPVACIIVVALAGITCLLGFIFSNLAVLSGKGALAMAVSQTQCFFWLLLDMVIHLRFPHLYEVFAMALGIAGAAVITFAKK